MSPKKELAPLTFSWEDRYAGRLVCGVDEAGRGPLAGRVYAAAVILPHKVRQESFVLALNDSKKLSEKKRTVLAAEVERLCLWSVAYCEVEEIETLNILEASLLAMRRALAALPEKPDVALIDGNVERDFPLEAHALIGGDGLSPSIAAASILAKTHRDRYCAEVLERQYPGYGFAVHKGYGTRAHYEALRAMGPCAAHRMSFLKSFYAKG